ncbi:MAG: GntR family transcriptional regulator [Rhodobacter sp.]|nr:GntR family transcriptional regulator [Paracoccaceae bacterium]MCC0076295.1 GntR family transcriptional regulator [Rhodobacter sp.]
MTSSTDLAYAHIKSAIMSGELKAGDRIKEELIAEKIGVSRTPIRHAIQKLTAQGFVATLHNSGARVADWSSQDLEEITAMRALLEGFGAGIAARKVKPEDMEILRDLAAEMEAAAARGTRESLEAITELNSRFHMAIIEASGNRRLAEVIGNLAHPLLVQRRFSGFSPERLQRSMNHHREIIDALASGSPEWATNIMRSHILSSAVDLET